MTPDQPKPATGEEGIEAQIMEYLSAGGPEKMKHEKVRHLLFASIIKDLREQLAAERGRTAQIAAAFKLEDGQLKPMQLAAEREKVRELEEQMRNILIAYDALKKVRK